MSVKNSVYAIPTAALDTAVLTGSFEQVGNGLSQACFELNIVNSSDVGLEISYDGVTQHDYVLATSTRTIQAQTNSQPTNKTALFPKGFRIWVSGPTGTGVVYISGYYSVPAGV